MDTTEWKMVQMMPSERWHAAIKFESTIEYVPLLGWALVEAGNSRFVSGLLAAPGTPGKVIFAESNVNFTGYHRI